MASFLSRKPLPAAWTVADHAMFAAQKEFELLKLLSTDKKALATARRLGMPMVHNLASRQLEGKVAAPAEPQAAAAKQKRPKRSQAERRARQQAACTLQRFRRALPGRRRLLRFQAVVEAAVAEWRRASFARAKEHAANLALSLRAANRLEKGLEPEEHGGDGGGASASAKRLPTHPRGQPRREAVRRASSPLLPGGLRVSSPLTLLPGLTLFSDAEEGLQLEQHEMAAAHAALGAGAAAP